MRDSSMKMWAYALFVMWLFPLWSMADNVQKLLISKNDGTEVSFLLSEEPIMTFCKDAYYDRYDGIEITTASSKMELSTFELDKMTIISVEEVTAITDIASEKETIFSWVGDALYVEVLKDKTTFVVYDMGGKMILSKSLGVGKHALSLSDLPKGMNIIKINDETIKIWNR